MIRPLAAALLLMAAPAQADPAFEAEVLAELNRARTAPAQFARTLRDFRSGFSRDRQFTHFGSDQPFLSIEGTPAVDEAIAFMARARPLPPLASSPLLAAAAADHTDEQGPAGRVGHQSRNGRWPADRLTARGGGTYVAETISYGAPSPLDVVIQLIVDDGVPSRGHRTILFDPQYQHIGIACGPHRTYRTMCTLSLAVTPAAR